MKTALEKIDSFEQARDYLHSFVDFERRGFHRHFAEVVNLDTIRVLLAALGNPQERFPNLHIAGTKGKGSTAALCEAALRAAGYRTGLFTSPHLLSMRERIRLEGKPIGEEEVVGLVRQVQPVAEELRRREGLNPPTFFELYTAMAFLAFAQAEVDIAVVEAGLGGRLDATNVLQPLVTVITSIGRDHMEILGQSLASIAREKAGILKPGVPLVLGEQEPEAERAILERARELQAPVRRAPRVRRVGTPEPLAPPSREEPLPQPTQEVIMETATGQLPVHLPLLGAHQGENLGLAWAATQILGEPGLVVAPQDFVRGVEAVRWPARCEIVEARPWLVLDCAHNQPSLQALAQALPEMIRYKQMVLVFGMSADKEIAEAAAQIAPLADVVILTQARMHRAMWVSELTRTTWFLWRATPHLTWTVAEALAQARELAGPQDCICVTGSFFVVGEAAAELGLPVR